MKPTLARFALRAAALALPLAGYAQTNPGPEMAATNAPAAPPPSAGLVNDWLRDQNQAFNPWDLGGQFRARLEFKEYMAAPGQVGSIDFRKNGREPDNTYLLLRQKVHLGYNSDWFGVFLEGQESSSTSDRRNPNLESDLFDLHQGFATLGNPEKFPLTAKVGRQEMTYGDDRLIGTFDWNNIGRMFDAVKLRYAGTDWWVDAFASHIVIPRDNHFDVSDNYDYFSGIYASSTGLVPWQESQLYFLSRNTGKDAVNFEPGALVTLPSPRDIYTVGTRFKSLPGKLRGWDYTLEADYQFGRYGSAVGAAPTAVTGSSKDQQAYAGHLDGGYTWEKAFGTPRAGLEFNYASGGNGAQHHTFDTLFPTTHMFAGIMDFYCWQNVMDARINLSIKPLPKFTVAASYRGVWLANTSDSFYLANFGPRTGGTVGGHNGYAVNPTYGSFVGTELDLVMTYNPTKYAQIQGGFGHFFVGDYVRDSLSAPGFGSTDANYLYLQTKFNF
jgi:hypothetical protein